MMAHADSAKGYHLYSPGNASATPKTLHQPPTKVPPKELSDEPTPGQGTSEQKGCKKTIGDYYLYVIYWGILRWLLSLFLLGSAAGVISRGSISTVKPYAIYNLVCVSPILLLLSQSLSG
jgi:hypothetical protein